MVSTTVANKGDRTEKLGITLPISLLQKIDNKRVINGLSELKNVVAILIFLFTSSSVSYRAVWGMNACSYMSRKMRGSLYRYILSSR